MILVWGTLSFKVFKEQTNMINIQLEIPLRKSSQG